jgi:hypothetical protein
MAPMPGKIGQDLGALTVSRTRPLGPRAAGSI